MNEIVPLTYADCEWYHSNIDKNTIVCSHLLSGAKGKGTALVTYQARQIAFEQLTNSPEYLIWRIRYHQRKLTLVKD